MSEWTGAAGVLQFLELLLEPPSVAVLEASLLMWALCRSAPRALRVSFASKSNHALLVLRAYKPEGRAMNKNITAVLLLVLAAGCSSQPQDGASAPPMDPARKVSEQVCSRPIDSDGNLMCREVTEAERRAKIAEEERQARTRREA